jgi:UTP--glucose-1-phosphate uridylyltransferase
VKKAAGRVEMGVVPVAGLGTRLLPATKSQPKEMLPVGRKPVVQYVVEELEANGVTQILFITGRNKSSIEDHFDFDHELTRHLREAGKEDLLPELQYERLKLEIFYSRQRRQRGLGDAVACAEHFTRDQPFVVALGDSILGLHGTSRAVESMVEAFERRKPACVIAVEEVARDEVNRYGIVRAAGDSTVFRITDLVEKPDPSTAPSNLAIAARYVFSPAIHAAIRRTRPDQKGEVQLTDAMRLLLEDGCEILGFRLPAAETRYDIGNFASYYAAFVEFALSDPQFGPALAAYLKERLAGERPR